MMNACFFRLLRHMPAMIASLLALPCLAIDIDSNDKVMAILKDPGFGNEFAQFNKQSGRRAMYLAVDETGIAFGTRESISMGVTPRWVYDDAKQICRKDRQTKGVQAECRLFIENDRFAHPDISLSPIRLAALMRPPAVEKDINQHHWQPPEPAIIRMKPKLKPAARGESKNESENTKDPVKEQVPVEDLSEEVTISKRDEEFSLSIEDPDRLFVNLDECVDADGKVVPGLCGVPSEEDRHLAMLKSIQPVTELSEKQLSDLTALKDDMRFKAYLRKYLQAPNHKAMALAVDGDRVATGLVKGLTRSLARMKKLALAQCRQNRIRKKIESGCFLYLQNDENLYPEANIAP